MPKELDIETLVVQNPKVDAAKVREVRALLRTLEQMGVAPSRSRPPLDPPFARKPLTPRKTMDRLSFRAQQRP